MSRGAWVAVLLTLLALLIVGELVAFDQLSSEKTDALDCWPNCTVYEDLIRTLAILVLPVTIIAVALAVLVILSQALVAALRRLRRR